MNLVSATFARGGNMKFEIIIGKDDYRLMQKNKYGHGGNITRSYMLDIVNNIIDQMDVSRPYQSHMSEELARRGSMTVKEYDGPDSVVKRGKA